MKSFEQLSVKVFADGADLDGMKAELDVARSAAPAPVSDNPVY